MTTLTIQVTQEDINNGAACAACECPVALAACRQIPRASLVSVSNTGIYLYTKDGRTGNHVMSKHFPLPVSVFSFMQDFDKHGRVEPFSFDLEVAE